MAQTASKARKGWTARVLAAVTLTAIYGFSLVGTSALFLTASTNKAEAQRGRGRGRGRGYYGRGRGWGPGYYRGRGRGYYRGYGGCVFNPVYGRVICY
ncbi:hypothetical protein OOZ54_21145 [Rhodopseudomonas palustris]|uniref:hypothetical protein n=1 Tax=Rhodopseudomonas palustris TaxID=1076 RepID=UPI000164947D|nr:hypothetical protein [Rhodopseudomonas palustris]ACF02994.1 conserved hypothetical protein [Rhodopseudomonas palustris TIE-1]QLH72976.1 hypothetical protein HZF03_20075 [Rhodopseudomonas palustris]RIA02376.1 hypothetical protein D1920_07820 [Rhodopseudomonas palustris]WBU29147.1 hypothetical protein OOZ54_21145 [Rhodopseudomonas palustris]